MNLPLPLISVKGTYGEMGFEYGRQAADLVARNNEDYVRRFRDTLALSSQEIHRLGRTYRKITCDYNRDIGEMLVGVAKGSGVDVEEVFALNARTEILYGQRNRTTECTSLSFLPDITVNGHTLIAENWDWHPEQSNVSVLLTTMDEQGFRVLTLTEAGMVAKTGFNSEGVGLCANLLVSDRDHRGEGVPYHILLRGVLQSKDMADAIRAAVDYPRVSSGNFLLADKYGESVDIEAVPDDFGYLLPSHGFIAHSNHFLSDVPVRDMRKAHSALTILRPTRAAHLLNQVIAKKEVRIEDIYSVFRDHYSYPNGICRHVDERDPVYDRNCTVYSVVMDLDELDYFIAQGPPCEHDYVRINLDQAANQAPVRDVT